MAQQTVNNYGIVRGGADIYNLPAGSEIQQNLDNRGSLLIAQSLPERGDLVRMGNSWGAQIKEANAFTLLITIPTTRSELVLQNCEASNGKSYLIDRVWLKCVTTTAAANYITLLAQVLPAGSAYVADASTKTVTSLSGKSGYTGKAQLVIAVTAPAAVQDKWTCIGNTLSMPTSTSIAAFVEAFVYGRYIIPPGGSFCMNAQEAVSGGTAIMGVEWHEVQLALG